MERTLTIEIDRSTLRGADSPRRRPRHKGEPGPAARPLRLHTSAGAVIASAHRIPLADGAIDLVNCRDVLAYVRNDEGLVREIARLLAPGGRVTFRVPATGPLAAFDAFNLYRYVVDISHRGARPHETFEIGWRRHYAIADLASMLGNGFHVVSARRTRLGVGELFHAGAMLAFRWIRPRRDRYRAAMRSVRWIERVEDRIATPAGIMLDITFESNPGGR